MSPRPVVHSDIYFTVSSSSIRDFLQTTGDVPYIRVATKTRDYDVILLRPHRETLINITSFRCSDRCISELILRHLIG